MNSVLEYRDIEGYEGLYKVSNTGLIWSYVSNRFMSVQKNKDGYCYVVLQKYRSRKHYYVHILVACAFIPKPDFDCEVNHKNGVKADCFSDNLEWLTHSDNIKHMYDTGLRQRKTCFWENWTQDQLFDFEKACASAL